MDLKYINCFTRLTFSKGSKQLKLPYSQIVKDGKFSHFLDGRDESQSNWMRFVNCSRCEDEQNLVAYQYRGEIYYRTYKSVSPGKELLVWYGESYAKDLGITICDDQENGRNGKSR